MTEIEVHVTNYKPNVFPEKWHQSKPNKSLKITQSNNINRHLSNYQLIMQMFIANIHETQRQCKASITRFTHCTTESNVLRLGTREIIIMSLLLFVF